MSESSTVIKHYKKQLIFRQHDICPDSNYVKKEDETKKIRRKRKNKNCRGQFRHEAMELIKLGTNPTHSFYKSKLEKPFFPMPNDQPSHPHHTLPQMVPEFLPSKPSLPHHPYPLRPSPHLIRPIPLHVPPVPKKRKLDSPPIVAAIDLTVDNNKEKCDCEEVPTKKPANDQKLPQLFLIKDLLAKGVKINQRPKNQSVIVSPRRRSEDIDTLSVSSNESMTSGLNSPKPDRRIPQGKLFYYKNNNSFIRYFEDTQKKLFFDSISSDKGASCNTDDKEIIELPENATFSPRDNLTVEEYVFEMTQVEKYVPQDFFQFYKFVTGYQICNNNLPVSFLTFLKVYNTNGLRLLLERYINSLKHQ